MPGWFFELVGDHPDLEQMATLFTTGAIWVAREDNKFWMRFPALDAIADHREAHESAESALKTLNGVSTFRFPNTGRVRLGSAEYGEASAPRSKFVMLTGVELKMRMGTLTVLIDGKPLPPKEDSMLTVALRNLEVDRVLRLYGARDPDWRDLYFILTVVETEISRSLSRTKTGKRRRTTVAREGWISKRERDRFTQTANSKHTIGDLARHGEDYKPPKNPMPQSEARQLIRDIVERWIREKVPAR